MEGNAVSEYLLASHMNNLSVNEDLTGGFDHTNNIFQEEMHRQIHRQKLIDAMRQQEAERSDTTFSRNCLLCKKHFTGNRSSLFLHLMDSHHLCIGHPDNIVYANEYLDVLSEKLKKLECFFCEKLFKDWVVLKEHMRKKQHKRLNPMNPLYDKFFVINYLEPGKKWKDFEGIQAYERDSDDENCEIEFSSSEQEDVICLFCTEKSKEVENIFDHMKVVHHFDFPRIIKEYKLDFYARVRLINYIRMQVNLNRCPTCNEQFSNQVSFFEHLIVTGHTSFIPPYEIWSDPTVYYFPVIQDDRLITSIENEQLFDGEEKEPVIIPEDIHLPQNSVLMNEQMRQMLLQEQTKTVMNS